MAASSSYAERFSNSDEAQEHIEAAEEGSQKLKEKQVELYGAAQDIFLQRIYDTFTVSQHGVDVDFYRPVDLTRARFTDLDDEDREIINRLEEGSRLIVKHKQRELETIKARNDDDAEMEIEEMVDQAFESADLQRRVLAAFAVDESMQDPDVWKSLFPQEDKVQDLFTDFLQEGEGQKMMRTLQMLQSRQSGN